MKTPQNIELNCPLPKSTSDKILLGHGSGGKLTARLLEEVFLPAFGNEHLKELSDSVVLRGAQKIVYTTDSYVVKPLFFPGGDIGKLAVFGTVNDLAMSGAKPLYLSAGFILEEGFEIARLKKIVTSMKEAAEETGVQIVTGDTKVVDRGKGDGVFINTSGIGILEHELHIRSSQIRPGDKIILSGDIGRHGVAVMSQRESLDFESPIQSDCASLWPAVKACLDKEVEVHCLRDLTRGGLATALVELAHQSGYDFEILEKRIPVDDVTRGACEILGLDPLYIANEGCMVLFVPEEDEETALEELQSLPVSNRAVTIGEVMSDQSAQVSLKSVLGPARLLHTLTGEQLPRIC